jgi:hypothetical protein
MFHQANALQADLPERVWQLPVDDPARRKLSLHFAGYLYDDASDVEE